MESILQTRIMTVFAIGQAVGIIAPYETMQSKDALTKTVLVKHVLMQMKMEFAITTGQDREDALAAVITGNR